MWHKAVLLSDLPPCVDASTDATVIVSTVKTLWQNVWQKMYMM